MAMLRTNEAKKWQTTTFSGKGYLKFEVNFIITAINIFIGDCCAQ